MDPGVKYLRPARWTEEKSAAERIYREEGVGVNKG